jgi:LysR family hydrogen peroxide-inducible transcriptional activator
MPTLRQLRYFDTLVRLRHFGLAAEHCAVTQPALSTQIQDLERKLGIELVERRYKNIQLTPAGEEIARRAARILAEVGDLADFARSRGEPLSGVLRLGVIPSIAPYMLPPLLPVLRERYPSLDLHIRETQTQTLIGELTAGGLDLLLLALPVEQPDIETQALFEDRFLLAMPPGRALKGPIRITPELAKNDRLLLPEEGHCLRDQALDFCQMRHADNIDTFGASSLSTIVQLVAGGMGLTLLPEMCLATETTNRNIALFRFAQPEPSRLIGLAWRASSPRKRDFAAFSALAGEIFAASGKQEDDAG